MSESNESKHSPEAGTPDLPPCFGDGERVCPRDADGVMQPQKACIPCEHLRPCLQLVLHRRGKIRLVEEPVSSKVTGFFRRWSDQKLSQSGKHKE